jgi:hypothetical protein
MKLAPIVLFVFNRPSHTRRTLQALEANALADLSELHIFADGPRMNSDTEQLSQISAVDEIICQDWNFKKIYIHRKKHNWGLADSIIDGVTRVVTEFGKVIVLEDDIITSPGFLTYMNGALDLYQQNVKVMHVSAYMFPVYDTLPPSFFYNTTSCWGWATWDRAWQHFNQDAGELLERIEREDRIKQFDIEDTYPFSDQLRANAKGELKTWAVKWYASFFLQGGFALHPYPSLVNNIGHDGGGENCGVNSRFEWPNLAQHIELNEIKIAESAKARELMQDFNRSAFITHQNGRHQSKRGFFQRLIRSFRKRFF